MGLDEQSAIGDLLTVRAYYFHANNPAEEYNVQAHFRARAVADPTEYIGLGQTFVDFIGRIAFDVAVWDRFTISTYMPDSRPYDPTAFISQDVGVEPSGRSSAGGVQVQAAAMVLRLRKVLPFGRQGRWALRLALAEGDVEAPAAKWILTNPNAINSIVAQAEVLSGFGDYLAGGSGPFELVVITPQDVGAPFVRVVTGLGANGVGTLSEDHAHYNRGSGELSRRVQKAQEWKAAYAEKYALLPPHEKDFWRQ